MQHSTFSRANLDNTLRKEEKLANSSKLIKQKLLLNDSLKELTARSIILCVKISSLEYQQETFPIQKLVFRDTVYLIFDVMNQDL